MYIKVDAQEPLLLSEGVCRQLGIIAYHPDVLAPTVQDNPPSTASLSRKLEGAAKSQSSHEQPGETEPDSGEVLGESSTRDSQSGEVEDKRSVKTDSTESGARNLSFGPATHSQNDPGEEVKPQTMPRWRGSQVAESDPNSKAQCQERSQAQDVGGADQKQQVVHGKKPLKMQGGVRPASPQQSLSRAEAGGGKVCEPVA